MVNQWGWPDTSDSREVAEEKEKIWHQNLGNNVHYYNPRNGRVIDGIPELEYELQPYMEDRPFVRGAREPQDFYHDVITGERITASEAKKNMFGLLQEYDYTPPATTPDKLNNPGKLDKDWLMIGGGVTAAVVPIVFGLGWLLGRMKKKRRNGKEEKGHKSAIPTKIPSVGRLHARDWTVDDG
jgi:hypothetical protein